MKASRFHVAAFRTEPIVIEETMISSMNMAESIA